MTEFFSVSTFKLAISFIQFIGCSIIIFNINIKLAIISYLFIPIYYIICFNLTKKINHLSFKTLEKNSNSFGKLQEAISGIKTIKILNQEKYMYNNLKNINNELKELTVKQNMILNVSMTTLVLLGNISSILILLLGGISIVQNKMTIGDYFAFSGYLPMVLTPVQLLASKSVSIQPGIIALKRVFEIFNKSFLEYEKNKKDLLKITGNIDVANLKFKYENSDKYVFEDFSFKIKPKDKVLIKGNNGSGKSTLVQLILGLYLNYDGNILIDNINIKDISRKSLARRIGIVSQDIFLFNSTIKENIIYDSESSINNMANMKELKGILQEFPNGLETAVGENGQLLSIGQKQLIAIARAIINDPDILIFDEATTNLDAEKKIIIKDIINTKFKDKTCIFISHDNILDFTINKYINLDKMFKGGDLYEA